jgi:hypothetical protein
MVCIGTPSSEKRKDFGRQFSWVAIVTFLGLWVSSPQMPRPKAAVAACLLSLISTLGLVVINQSSHFSYFRGLGYRYPRILWEYFFGRKPFGDKKNHNGRVEPLQF